MPDKPLGGQILILFSVPGERIANHRSTTKNKGVRTRTARTRTAETMTQLGLTFFECAHSQVIAKGSDVANNRVATKNKGEDDEDEDDEDDELIRQTLFF